MKELSKAQQSPSMPSDDLKNYASSETDFYTLLGITFETSQRDIDRAWRRTALKYHPDKVGNDPIAKEKFHLAQIGYDLLSDPAIKALYDSTRTARLQRERKNELLKGQRRTMADDLLARERGVKRGRSAGEDDEEKLEREIRRLAEDGKRRRKEREDTLRKEMQPNTPPPIPTPQTQTPTAPCQSTVSELDRTIKIRWPYTSTPIPPEHITNLFSHFGPVQSADILPPKPAKNKHPSSSSSRKPPPMATCMIQYASVVGAHAAVADFPKQKGPEWRGFASVTWARDRAPAFIVAQQQHHPVSPDSAQSTPQPTMASPGSFFFQRGGKSPALPATTTTRDGAGSLGKKPSFASFSAAAKEGVRSSPLGSPPAVGGAPSLEEMTLIRLKEAEQRRVREQVGREDAAAAAAAATLGI